ncbi:unnamed protein product [Candida verbasci]|uniref:3,2-trans-enoyl-CoA isomerase n=1 Tax=Candida verbasci TaxID=1227364 RepID=A0A9W4TUL4_9ASCO|nr:unnamed protein product [Candida verbasci]
MSDSADITYTVQDKIVVISLQIPTKLNALTHDQYIQLGKYLEQSNEEEDTIATVIQSSGRYFSAGANFGEIGKGQDSSKLFTHEYWLDRFVARNVWLTNVFNDHKKILIAAINGPVIGLSSALVLLCDLIYVNDLSKFYLLAPFANLGLVAEGSSSATLFARLGWSKSSEALLLAKPINGQDCFNAGFITKHYNGRFGTNVDEFNKTVVSEIQEAVKDLHDDSILQNKQLLKLNRDQLINAANSQEAQRGLYKWLQGVPQAKFAQLATKEKKHKL